MSIVSVANKAGAAHSARVMREAKDGGEAACCSSVLAIYDSK